MRYNLLILPPLVSSIIRQTKRTAHVNGGRPFYSRDALSHTVLI